MHCHRVFMLLLATGACGKSDSQQPATGRTDPANMPGPASGSGSPTTTATASPASTSDPAVPWSTDHAAAIAKLQGVWLVKGFGSYGSVSAWKFDGTKVTVYDPRKQTEKPDVLLFESPCAVRLDSGYGGTLVIDGDDIYLGLGNGGMKQGDTVIACVGGGTVYATPKGCTTYKRELRKWKAIETTCSQPEGRFVAVETGGRESSLRFWTDQVLLTDQLHGNKLVRHDSWETGKQAADQLAKR